MRREIGGRRAVMNAVFVAAVLGLAAFGAARVAGRQWRTQQTFQVRAEFANIGGVEAGARVRLQGIDAGVVESVIPPQRPSEQVALVFRVDDRLRSLIRADASARIVTDGVVGAKVVEIATGRPDAQALGADGLIRSEPSVELNDLLKRAQSSLARINAVADAAERGLGEINSIASTVRKGEGSLGKFVKEDEAYRKVVSLSERGEQTLDDMKETIGALKQTWPLSSYFKGRAYFDREQVLFRPGSLRDSQTLAGDDLFERGRAVLTESGRKKLDSVGVWLNKIKRPASEVVIAAYSDEPSDSKRAHILTEEQAQAVRDYLVKNHSLTYVSWWKSRKVAAVGFGSEAPGDGTVTGANTPPRRVEIILFTPQA